MPHAFRSRLLVSLAVRLTLPRRLFWLALSSAVPGVVAGQDAAAAYRRDLLALCTDDMAGRAAGTAGGDRAIDWLERRFADVGLRPVVGDRLRQEFLVPDPLPPAIAPATVLALRLAEGTFELAPEAAGPFPFSTDGKACAPLVFAGHGLAIAELGLDDYRGLEVRGRVAMVLRGGPRWRDGRAPIRAHLQALTFGAKAAAAAARGAVALVVVDRGDRGHEELDAALVRRTRGTTAIPVAWLHRSAAARCFAGGDAGLRAAVAALDENRPPPALRAGAALDLRIELQRRPPRTTANVVGLLPGSCPERADEIVVVGAHHDHIGRGEFGSLAAPEEVGLVHPGADDNASGVAGLLELARRCRGRGAARRSIVFAAFGAEELGQHGSRWFLDHLPATGQVVAMIDLNMIGRGSSGQTTVYGVDTGTGLRALVQRAAGRTLQQRDRTSFRSDQGEFLGRGVPALLFTTGLHEQYHRPGDVPELVEVPAALAIVDVVDAVLQGLAAGPAPRFVPGRDK
jgi:hypothetical protein